MMKKRTKRLLSCLALILTIAILSVPAAYALDSPSPDTGTVQNLSLTLSADRAYLTWKAVPGVSSYEIYYDNGSGQIRYGTATGTAFRGKGLSAATYYTFYVYSCTVINGKRTLSASAAEISGWTLPGVPSYTVTKTSDTYSLSWSAINGASCYEILTRMTDTKEWTVAATVSGTSYSLTLDNVDEVFFGVRTVMYKKGTAYRSDFRKKLCSDIPTTGSMISFGDSIGKGAGSQYYAYPEMLAHAHHLSLKNYSVSGATLSQSETAHCICSDVEKYINSGSNCSFIIIDGGHNDYALDMPLGEVTPDGSAAFDRLTVCGALETMFTRIQTDTPNAKVIFVMVHEVTNSYTEKNALGLTFSDYKTGIFSVCQKYGVTIADCSAMRTADSATCLQYTSTRLGVYPNGDGTHPNEEGYEEYYMPAIEAVFADLDHPVEPTEAPTDEPPTAVFYLIGDADGDGAVTVLDATIIQRYLANYTVNDPEKVTIRGDVGADGLNILDVTMIQRYLANYSVPFDIGHPVFLSE